MKTIGLIGGMSWESSLEYYRTINKEMNKRLGGLHSAECLLYSVDFEEIERLQSAGQWQEAGEQLARVAQKLEQAGAGFVVICTNTMHKVVGQIEEKISIPVLHIADATAAEIRSKDLVKVGLLGTSYTMEQDFYRSRIESHDIDVLVPPSEQRGEINRIIFEELVAGELRQTSRETFQRAIRDLMAEGAEGIILGCTEIGLLIKPEDADVPVFDTAQIHAVAAVNKALKNDQEKGVHTNEQLE
ncbi:aspartate/glutamate racemase family protein [Planomicrobium sp. Y74]|uniref:aspartate/glutamate racemase family protein n=1 Tax=Planomicrobium sp. Y74 TaxID=2478977 RepID=UPI000EF47368|nr:aspartate/glutamate racemase family protein [Planomicrobium sp. Y74]RLQ90250.1 aspartate/glutamate racemase family protein [Planomicrobium sp. Y74]